VDPATLGAYATVGVPTAAGAWWYYRHRTPKVDRWAILLAQWEQIAKHAGLDDARLLAPRGDEWGWTSPLALRPGQTIEDAASKRRRLESALGTRRDAVRFEELSDHAGHVLLRVVERDPHAEPIPWPGPSGRSITRPITLGPFETGVPVRVSLLRKHVLIVGATDSGKSGLVNLIVGELAAAPDAVVWGIDLKGGVELKPWAPALGRLATNAKEAEVLLKDAVGLIETRAARMAATTRTWTPTAADPAVYVVVDEQGEVDAKAHVPLEDSIARRGRAMAVCLVTSLQRGTMDALQSNWIRSQSAVRICLRVEEDKEADLVFGQGARDLWPAHRLNLPGKFLIRAQDPGLSIARPGRVFWVDDAQVRATAQRYAGRQPHVQARAPVG
jgi:S-DNA-T family DNA segregation ATPase FtsK/SpoIIIE